MSDFWDKRYSEPSLAYGKEPNVYFKQKIDLLQTGKLLLPGEGEGRNSLYAAKKGWEVTAIDSSVKAKEKALALANKNKIRIEYIVSPIESYNFRQEEFNAAALIFVHFPTETRTKIHDAIINSLKPGGALIIEAFSKKQISHNTGGPKSIEMLYDLDDLLIDFKEMNIEESYETQIDLHEGKYHRGIADVIRIFAKK
jgi:2-polyprenyl-3-methyl-5-hydroxy-6-metoxy-1,4-benzoquinol methylase